MNEINNDIEVNVEQAKKNKKTFKEYYADPEFKKKHLEKYRQKITCECGAIVGAYNMTKHKKTNKHLKISELKEAKLKRIEKELDKCKEMLKNAQNDLKV